ncbi:hypothetical protein HKK72_25750, partial [Actinomadura sp. HBU206391]|nr:hypothetical protein [Actinomadura sp. HBU206391]
AVARRDPNFRGIDPDALGELIKQVQAASAAITGWLNAHRPPPGVPTGGYRQAQQAEQWAAQQIGMLARRRNYAITHPDRGGGVQPPASPPRRHGGHGPRGHGADEHGAGKHGAGARPHVRTGPGHRIDDAGHGTGAGGAPEHGGTGGPPWHRTTPSGAGEDLGSYPDRQAAAKAARADAAAFERAAGGHGPVPADVWLRLGADADDPDYTEAFYARLGPAGTAELIAVAGRDDDDGADRVKAIEESLGTADRHLFMTERWLREVLAAADRTGHRAEVAGILDAADLSGRTDQALARLGPQDAPPPDGPAGTGDVPRTAGEDVSPPRRAG